MPTPNRIRQFTNHWGLSRLDLSVAALLTITIVGTAMSFYRTGRHRQLTAEAANFLADIHRSQQIYHSIHGVYSNDLGRLDLRINSPLDFDIEPIRLTDSGWIATAIRSSDRGVATTVLSIDQTGWVGSDHPLHRKDRDNKDRDNKDDHEKAGQKKASHKPNSRQPEYRPSTNRFSPTGDAPATARLIAQRNGQS